MQETIECELRQIRLFADLDRDALARIAAASYLQSFPPEVTLYTAGRPVDFVHGIISGQVGLHPAGDGNTPTIMVVGPGSLVPLNGVFSSDSALCSSRTLVRSRIVMAPALLLRKLVEENWAFGLAALRHADELNRQLLRELHNRSLRKPYERLAHWIHEQVAPSQDEQVIDLVFSKKVLASMLGMSMATLARDIDTLEQHGVSFEGRLIRIRNPQALTAIAQPPSAAEI